MYKIIKKMNIDLEKQKEIIGYIFISPFIIGFLIFFFAPFFQSLMFSISELDITSSGFELNYVGLENYDYSFFVHSDFNQVFTETVIETILQIPMIIIFSFFIASVLNMDFRGRLFARIAFFLPVITRSGILLRLQSEFFYTAALHEADEMSVLVSDLFSGTGVQEIIYNLQLPDAFLQYILDALGQVPSIIDASAIPILIFLAGLQSVPSSLYESAEIDGATGWEKFWKITYPLLTPLFLTNIVYIIIENFTRTDNELIQLVNQAARELGKLGVSMAMTWIYFIFVGILLLIVISVLRRYIVFIE